MQMDSSCDGAASGDEERLFFFDGHRRLDETPTEF